MHTTVFASDINSVLNTFNGKPSPFSLYEGETAKLYCPEGFFYTSVSELDKQIIGLVNRYGLLTSNLICCALSNSGVQEADEITVKHRLRALTKAQYLNKTEIFNACGVSAVRVYSVGFRGRGLLKATSVAPRLAGYISTLAEDQVRIKKILSANQFLIRTGVPAEAVESCQVVFSKRFFSNSASNIFRPQAVVKASDSTNIIESVKRNVGWEKELLAKMDRMDAVFRRRTHNIELKAPYLTLIAEDPAHMKEIMRIVSAGRHSFPIFFTCDTLTYSTPENCLYKVAEEPFLHSLFKKAV